MHWVPSHGKKPNWRPDELALTLGTGEAIRGWNEIADKAADQGRKRKERAQGREEWESRVTSAAKWSERAMNRLLLGVGEYIDRDAELKEKWSDAFQTRSWGFQRMPE